ncbi:MAG TPA: hypothetical protein VIH92_06145 [Solirubrobacteraceae bacterium]
MVALPMKPEYGPTLGRLLAPRWNVAPRLARLAVVTIGVGLVVVLIGAGLTLENAHYSHGGPVPFSFAYRDLYRVTPEPGGYVKVESRWPNGELKYSYAVDPLRLPPYSGELTAEIPLFATSYVNALSRRYRDFALSGEGKSKINNTLTGYQVAYSAVLDGEQVYGRDILMVPQGSGARDGVVIRILAATSANVQVTSPREVAETGILLRPLKTFSFS